MPRRKLSLAIKALIIAVAAAVCAAGSCAGFLSTLNVGGNSTGTSGAVPIAFAVGFIAGVVIFIICLATAFVNWLIKARTLSVTTNVITVAVIDFCAWSLWGRSFRLGRVPWLVLAIAATATVVGIAAITHQRRLTEAKESNVEKGPNP